MRNEWASNWIIELSLLASNGRPNVLWMGGAKKIKTPAFMDYEIFVESAFCRFTRPQKLSYESTPIHKPMPLIELIVRLRRIQPDANDEELARLAFVLTRRHEDLSVLVDEHDLRSAIRDVDSSIASLQEQRHAVNVELENLAADEPIEFEPMHVWSLVRGIRTQEKILDFYGV